MNLSDLGEAGFLDLLRDWTGGATGEVVLGPGDDAAILRMPGSREIVVSTSESSTYRRQRSSSPINGAAPGYPPKKRC